ncbi:MAG: L,D-transpeptidase family protein [Alphaproteobacteria bacterium]
MRRLHLASFLAFVGRLLGLFLIALPVRVDANTYTLDPGQSAVGNILRYKTRDNDTLLDIARNFDLGYTELIAANRGIDPWLPGVGKRVVIPSLFLLPDTPHKGIVINIARQRLFYYPPDGQTVETFPIGVGAEGSSTPIGATRVVRKKQHPIWYPTASERQEKPELPAVVPAGPDNPMGDYALYLGFPAIAIHGTDKPYGVGRNVSHGCIRLYPEDIERLFQQVPVGTEVRVIGDEAQLAWVGNDLYLAVFPNLQQTDQLDTGQPMEPVGSEPVQEQVMSAVEGDFGRIDWDLVQRTALERTGIPTRVSLPAAGEAATAPSE